MPPEADHSDDTPDSSLVERSQRGDLAAFDVLVTRHRGRVYGLVYNLVRNETEAWDLAQEVFIKAWRALPKFQGQSAFFTWIYRIAHNVALDYLRSRKHEAGGVEFDEGVARDVEPGAPTAPREERAPDERLAHQELGQRINEALAQLSADHRAVVLLREVEGLSYEEIAEAVGCSLGTVMSRLFYARKKLQSLLADLHPRQRQ